MTLGALLLSAFVQFGTVGGVAAVYEAPEQALVEDFRAYADIGARVEWGPLYIGGNVRTDMSMMTVDNWLPQQVTFVYEAGARIGPLTAGIKRVCYHPIMPYMTYYGYDVKPASEGASWGAYIRLDIKGR